MLLRKNVVVMPVFCVMLLAVASSGMWARDPLDKAAGKAHQKPERIRVIDGSNVHDVGELQVHVANWGLFGSFPSSNFPCSHAPSAQWPAGSGIEHLFGAGLWVGAIKNGVPHVSTSLFEFEFMPTDDTLDVIYRTFEGAPNGARIPSPFADDDGDGARDEDFLDGHDNDGDGLIDEDFAAVSTQMFSCWFTDDQPNATGIYPEHEPLNLLVRQESYQWDDPRFDDFVGIKFTITNTGNVLLEDVHLGFFADCDVGHRDRPQYWEDDAEGSWRGARCTDIGPAHLNIGYCYDADGDEGMTTSYFGVMLLGHTIDPLGLRAPRHVELHAYRVFSGTQPYENGGDPVNDFQRYEVLSTWRIDANSPSPRDVRFVMSTGSFPELPPGETIVIHIGLVAGEGLEGMLDNAASAQRLFDGIWYDFDGDPATGIAGRESPVYGPAQNVYIDECRLDIIQPIDVPAGSVVWINNDCQRETERKHICSYGSADSLLYRTGVAGRETQINWFLDVPPLSLPVLDIRPRLCPNPFHLKWIYGNRGRKRPWGALIRIAILGMENFDVRDIDISSLRLEGVEPLRWGRRYRDVSRPVTGKTGCECTAEGRDGYRDLILRFRAREIGEALRETGPFEPGDERMLTLTGLLEDGTAFTASDCVVFIGRCPRPGRPEPPEDKDEQIRISPNPFNPVTRITFYLAEPRHVRISIYDVSGRLIEQLADGWREAGEHTIEWRAGGIASGIYFLHMDGGTISQTRKMILLR
ncbi:MAG: T9SS type A sorting domain-containing protein [bacterium]|nr:MAG: T9SS type A sorting domain-containing protein [bacterium]